MISAITNRGKMEFMFYRDSMNQERFKEFLERLVKNSAKKPFLIVDNLNVRHGNDLKPWLKENEDKIRLFFLPSYSPELNPDEYLNGNLKRELGKMPYAATKAEVQEHAQSVMDTFVEYHVVKYFKHPDIAYAA